MSHAAAHDIALLESMGFTRNEAIDLVISRALRTDDPAVDERSARLAAHDRRAYLDELRGICLVGAY